MKILASLVVLLGHAARGDRNRYIDPLRDRLRQLAASWVLSAEGQVLLLQLHQPASRATCQWRTPAAQSP